jgi:TRAP-type uncharacterized transport system substrate-binding protein
MPTAAARGSDAHRRLIVPSSNIISSLGTFSAWTRLGAATISFRSVAPRGTAEHNSRLRHSPDGKSMSRQEWASRRYNFKRPACVAAEIVFRVALVAVVLLGGQRCALAQSGLSGSGSEQATLRAPPRNKALPRKQASENRYTAGFVTGPPYSTEFSMVQDIATVLTSGQETGPHGEMALRILPMVGTGGDRNILDVLSLANADMAIVPVVLANRLRDAGTYGDIRRKLVYITLLHTEEFHLLVRPEIQSIADLEGKTVSLGEQDSAGDELGREVFDAAGVKVNAVNLDLDAALDQMQRGQISGALVLSGKPVKPLLALNARLEALRFLPIPYSQALQRDFLPSRLHHADYPNIIADGESVDTVAIESALFAYNWPARSQRFALLETFTESFFSRFPELREDNHHPKWREVNLAARLPGWERFGPAERWLDRQSMGEAVPRNGAGGDPNSSGNSPEQNDKLFREFLQWRDRQQVK